LKDENKAKRCPCRGYCFPAAILVLRSLTVVPVHSSTCLDLRDLLSVSRKTKTTPMKRRRSLSPPKQQVVYANKTACNTKTAAKDFKIDIRSKPAPTIRNYRPLVPLMSGDIEKTVLQ